MEFLEVEKENMKEEGSFSWSSEEVLDIYRIFLGRNIMIQNRKLWVLLGTLAQAGYLSFCKHLSSSVQMLCSGSGSWLTWGTARPDGTSCASRPGIAYKSSTEEEMDGTASVVLSVPGDQLVGGWGGLGGQRVGGGGGPLGQVQSESDVSMFTILVLALTEVINGSSSSSEESPIRFCDGSR